MNKTLAILIGLSLIPLAFGFFTRNTETQNLSGGTGTIGQLDQWKKSGNYITQNVAGTSLKLTGYESSGDCLVTDASGVVTTSTCGAGGSVDGTGTSSQLAYFTDSNTLSSVATGTLTTTATGLSLDASRGLVGGSAVLSLASGYGIPLTASTTAWAGFYDTPSTRITAGDHIDWSTNTLNVVTTGDWTGTLDGLEASAFEQGLTAGDGLTRTANDFDCDTASGTVFGCLSSANWTTFNGKQNALSVTHPIRLVGDTLSLAFSTTTANTWSSLQIFGYASSTGMSGTNLNFTNATTSSFFSTLGTFTNAFVNTLLTAASAVVTNLTATNATTTNLGVATSLNLFGGGAKTTANALCIQLTGHADLCDGSDDGGGVAGVQLPTYIVAASGGDYTTIQGALDACGTAGGGSIYLTDSTYAQGGTGLRFKGNGCHIYGRGSGTTTITFTGATTLFKSNSAAATYSNNGVHDVVITADGNTSGIVFDMSDMSNQHYSNVIADNIGTFIRIDDTQNITFYNTFEKFYATTITALGLNASSTNPTNGNRFIDGFFGYGANVKCAQFNNSNGTLFQSIRCEPSSTTGTTGLYLFDNTSAGNDGVFGNNFDDLYVEGNAVGINVATSIGAGGGIKRNIFSGMVESNTLDLSLGTNVIAQNTFFNITDSNFGNAITSFQPFFGIGTTTPVEEFAVVGDSFVSGTSTTQGLVVRPITASAVGTTTIYVYSKAAGFGGNIVLEDSDAAGCTRISTLNGVISGAIITCPTEI